MLTLHQHNLKHLRSPLEDAYLMLCAIAQRSALKPTLFDKNELGTWLSALKPTLLKNAEVTLLTSLTLQATQLLFNKDVDYADKAFMFHCLLLDSIAIIKQNSANKPLRLRPVLLNSLLEVSQLLFFHFWNSFYTDVQKTTIQAKLITLKLTQTSLSTGCIQLDASSQSKYSVIPPLNIIPSLLDDIPFTQRVALSVYLAIIHLQAAQTEALTLVQIRVYIDPLLKCMTELLASTQGSLYAFISVLKFNLHFSELPKSLVDSVLPHLDQTLNRASVCTQQPILHEPLPSESKAKTWKDIFGKNSETRVIENASQTAEVLKPALHDTSVPKRRNGSHRASPPNGRRALPKPPMQRSSQNGESKPPSPLSLSASTVGDSESTALAASAPQITKTASVAAPAPQTTKTATAAAPAQLKTDSAMPGAPIPQPIEPSTPVASTQATKAKSAIPMPPPPPLPAAELTRTTTTAAAHHRMDLAPKEPTVVPLLSAIGSVVLKKRPTIPALAAAAPSTPIIAPAERDDDDWDTDHPVDNANAGSTRSPQIDMAAFAQSFCTMLHGTPVSTPRTPRVEAEHNANAYYP